MIARVLAVIFSTVVGACYELGTFKLVRAVIAAVLVSGITQKLMRTLRVAACAGFLAVIAEMTGAGSAKTSF